MAKKKIDGIQPFEEIFDSEEGEVEDEISDEEMEGLMATDKESAKAKARRAKDAEIEEDDEDEDNDEVEDEADVDDETDDEDDEEDDDEEDDEWAGFAPFIVHEQQEWDLDDILSEAEPGETVILYHLETKHWYKLEPIKIGELQAK